MHDDKAKHKIPVIAATFGSIAQINNIAATKMKESTYTKQKRHVENEKKDKYNYLHDPKSQNQHIFIYGRLFQKDYKK